MIAKRIEKLIEELNLTKNSFSKAIGLTNNVTIGRIINEGRDPSYDTLIRIIQTYSCINIKWLLLGEGKIFIEKDESQKPDFNTEAPVNIENKLLALIVAKDKKIEEQAETIGRLRNKIEFLEEEIHQLKKYLYDTKK